MLSKILSWLFGPQTANHDFEIKVSIKEPSDKSSRRPRKTKVLEPATVVGHLTHKKIYCFGVTQSGQTTTPYHVCLDRHSVFSIAIDSTGNKHRCCLPCLNKLGGEKEIERATARSGYAWVVWESIEALNQLLAEFPDLARRPYGEKTLRDTVECPILKDPWRIIKKIKERAWTEYDLARIEGRPEPPSKYK